MEKDILLEGLRTRKPPAEFQDVCLIFLVQLGLRYNWRISMLQVLHAGNVLFSL